MATLTHATMTVFQAKSSPRQAPSLVTRALDTLHIWRRRARERRRLAELNEYELRDFGASSADRFQELAKPFWRG
jgi:uncharacterized protein YjiS (DUF1127 family)